MTSAVPPQDLMDRLIAVNSDAKMNSLFHFEQSHTFGLRYGDFFFLSLIILLRGGKADCGTGSGPGGSTHVFTRRTHALDGLTRRALLILPGSERPREGLPWIRKVVVCQFPVKIDNNSMSFRWFSIPKRSCACVNAKVKSINVTREKQRGQENHFK